MILDIEQRTGGALRLGTGTLYTAIARLVELGLIADTGRADERRRYYKLLPLGRAVLRAETARLEALVRHAHDRGVRPVATPAVLRRS
jgi:DNA-binding PadR family transcriptional regulator